MTQQLRNSGSLSPNRGLNQPQIIQYIFSIRFYIVFLTSNDKDERSSAGKLYQLFLIMCCCDNILAKY